jgi:protein-S-isoprenylcysteine O-methyltransferase Ste14
MIFLDVLIIVFLFLLFGVSHTILASNKLKENLVNVIGDKIAFYRLFYNISSLIILVALYEIAPKPNLIIYDLQYPLDIIVFALQVISIIGFFWASKGIGIMEFLGINQIFRYFDKSYNTNDLDEKTFLKLNGAYKYSRHPIYLFSILFLGLRPTMDLFYLVMFISITLYFYIGSFYEEKKLVEKYGVEYKKYQKKVPRIFPIKLGGLN